LKIILLISFFNLLLNTSLFSNKKDIVFDQIFIGDEYSQNRVYHILQDRKGFIWFATSGGVFWFDGYEAKKLNLYSEKHDRLINNQVHELYEDRSGKIWIGSYPNGVSWYDKETRKIIYEWTIGLSNYDRETGKITNFRHDPQNPNSLGNGAVNSICEDSSGTLWIGTSNGGLNRLNKAEIDFNNPQSTKFIRYLHEKNNSNSLSDNNIHDLYLDKTGVLWIATRRGGLNKLDLTKVKASDPPNVKFTIYQHDPENPFSLSHNDVRCIFENSSGMLWIGTGAGGLNKFDRKTERFFHYKPNPQIAGNLSSEFVSTICEGEKGILWVGTAGGGLNRFDKETEKFICYRSDPKKDNSLCNDFVPFVYKDFNSIIWIATKSGVNKINIRKSNFVHHHHETDNQNSLSNNSVNNIVEDHKGLVWIGTNDGLNCFDRATGKFTRYKHDPDNPNSINDNYISCLYEDGSGTLWIATEVGLDKLDKRREKFFHFQIYADVTHKNVIKEIYEDQSGFFWFVTSGNGVIRYDPYSDKRYRFQYDKTDQFSIGGDFVSEMFEDAAGEIWFATWANLNKFDRDGERFNRYSNQINGRSLNLINDMINDPYDPNNCLWLGYNDDALSKFDKRSNSFTHYQEIQSVASMLSDNQGNIWMSGDKGLIRFNPQTKACDRFNNKDGIRTVFSKPNSCCYSKETEEMFFGGINGFLVFHPNHIKTNAHIPPVFVTDFKILNQNVPIKSDGSSPLRKDISETKEIHLAYDQNTFSFEFAALDYMSPGKNLYAYKMEGLDKDWIQSGTKRFVNYNRLRPGKYIFRVKGCNDDGIWNEQGTSIRVIIHPPWWESKGAYAFYILFFISLITGLWRFQLKRIHEKNELKMKLFEAQKLQEIDTMKSRFFANISHEFRTPLTLILGPLEQFINHTFRGDPQKQYRVMFRYGNRLLQLINQLLDLSKLEAQKMTLHACALDIIEPIKGIVASFESMAKQKEIMLALQTNEEQLIVYIDLEKFEKIIINLLHNALKYTREGGRVNVSVSKDIPSNNNLQFKSRNKETIKINVEDTGIGITADRLEKIFDRFYQVDDTYTRKHEGTGIGLALTKELVELHHGEIQVTSELGKGSTFSVFIPLGKKHLGAHEIAEDVDSKIINYPSEVKEIQALEASTESEVIKVEKSNSRFPKSAPIILIVEDNADFRNYIRQQLFQTYNIQEAVDGADGLEKAKQIIPDLIVSDVMMPKIDGIQLCHQLKTEEITSHIPVILLTARASEQSKVDGLETGADDYLTKPFNVRELHVRIKNLINQRKRLRERFSHEVTLKAKEIAVTSTDEKFLNRAMEIVEKHMAEAEFDTQSMAWEVGMSRMQLHRKLSALTNHTPREFIRVYRLKRAAQLLDKKAGNVTEIAYEVGFNNISHFAKRFRELFGVSPSEYLSNKS
jgi:signal transduction histidine kinase/ligand-binding sensor domain-containing protein/DNA-binding response OmpR family regulator